MRILIIHDRFQYRGGGERLVLDMAKILNADICTEFWTDETYSRDEVPAKLFVLDQGEPPAIVWRYFRAQWNFWHKTKKLLADYDTIVFSGNNCLAAALRPLKGKKKIFYCHSPVRYVYDLFEMRRAEEPSMVKRVVYYDMGKWVIRGLYRLGLLMMDKVIANSKTVQSRLKKYCNTESQVVYPPIRTALFRWLGQGDYYLSWARLDPLKRVSRTVLAFAQLPDKKLVVASGGDDLERVRELAKGFPNIKVLGWTENDQLAELVGNCIAGIYVPVNEDFGMTPVEGMSAGKPIIGVAEGGLTESIVPGKTGILIPAGASPDDIAQAVRELTPEKALAMRAACEAKAAEFSLENFEKKIKEAIGI